MIDMEIVGLREPASALYFLGIPQHSPPNTEEGIVYETVRTKVTMEVYRG